MCFPLCVQADSSGHRPINRLAVLSGATIAWMKCPNVPEFLSHNDCVHRAAANDSPLESRAARGSVCNALLSRVFRFGFTVDTYNKFNWQVVQWNEFFGIETILRPVNHARQFPILRWDQREPINE